MQFLIGGFGEYTAKAALADGILISVN